MFLPLLAFCALGYAIWQIKHRGSASSSTPQIPLTEAQVSAIGTQLAAESLVNPGPYPPHVTTFRSLGVVNAKKVAQRAMAHSAVNAQSVFSSLAAAYPGKV